MVVITYHGEKKFSLDIWYVKNRTFKIDILIIYKTILKVIKMENISQKGHVTVENFQVEKMERTRFKNWNYPKIKDGLPNKYNWVVQYVDEFKLGYKTDIGAFSYINAKRGVTIGDYSQLDLTALFIQSPQLIKKEGAVFIGQNCKIGSHTTILPNVTIGNNSIIEANSLVNKNIPENVMAFGIPAKIIKTING